MTKTDHGRDASGATPEDKPWLWPAIAYLLGAVCAAIAAYMAFGGLLGIDWAVGAGICLGLGMSGRRIQDASRTSTSNLGDRTRVSLGGWLGFVGLCVLSGLLTVGFLLGAPTFDTFFSETGLTVPLATRLAVSYASWLVVPLALAWCAQLTLTILALSLKSKLAVRYATVVAATDFTLVASLVALFYLPLLDLF